MNLLRGLFGAPKERTITGIDAASLEAPGRRRRIEIVGERFRQSELIKIAGAKTRDSVNLSAIAALIPDPANPHDKNAVEVRIDGRHIGYLGREQAVGYHGMMASLGFPGRALGNVEARIYGGRILEDGYKRSYEVSIYLPESLAKQIGIPAWQANREFRPSSND